MQKAQLRSFVVNSQLPVFLQPKPVHLVCAHVASEASYSRLRKLFAAESLRAGLSIAGLDGTETTYTGDVDNISPAAACQSVFLNED